VRFRRFSAEKPAGYGVFARHMSVQKRSMRKTFDKSKVFAASWWVSAICKAI
jgi:hypothetical protein